MNKRLKQMISRGGQEYDFIDVYNQNVMHNICGTITTGISFRNNQFVMVRGNERHNVKKYIMQRTD